MPHDTRDQIVDYVAYWSERTEIPRSRYIPWLGIGSSKFYDWRKRYGKVNEHNAWIPRDHWLEDWERRAIIAFFRKHSSEGYRRNTFMMLDEDVVAASSSTVYRVLKRAGFLDRWPPKASLKGTGFVQPQGLHAHWHVDISYLNICGTFFYLCAVLDGYSRYIVHGEIRERMCEADVEIVLQRAQEKYPKARPRIISDNGPQFIAKDFKDFIRLTGMSHVRTSPGHPQSNGKLERWFRSFKEEGWRPGTPISVEDGRSVAELYIKDYHEVRLHSAIGFIAPIVKLEGREKEVFTARDEKLEQARERRAQKRKQLAKKIHHGVDRKIAGG